MEDRSRRIDSVDGRLRFGTVGIFRLVRDGLLAATAATQSDDQSAAWLAAIIYAANPNLIYLQATAMTEPLYLALFIWAVVYFSEFVQESARPDESTRASRIVVTGQVRLVPGSARA